MKAVGADGKVFDTNEMKCFEEMLKVARAYSPTDASNAALTIAVWTACFMSETLPEAVDMLRNSVLIMEAGARNSFGPIKDVKMRSQPDEQVRMAAGERAADTSKVD